MAGTAFQREKGAVRVACVFDPHQPYGELMQLASIDDDYTEALRDALVKKLLPVEVQAKRRPDIKELEWEAIHKLPERVLAECVFKDAAKLEEYMSLLKGRISAAFRCVCV